MYGLALEEAVNFLSAWLAFRIRQVDYPGLSVAVRYQDKEIFCQAFGMADAALAAPLTVDHSIGVGSQSKMFTATAILRLVADGLLRLDDPAKKYLPWLDHHRDARLANVTIRELLSHSSGLIRDGRNADFWINRKSFPDSSELQKMTLAADLVFAPSTHMKYSNLGYALLGQIIEAATGVSYGEYLTSAIMEPLALSNTSPDWHPGLLQYIALGYTAPFEQKRTPIDAPASMASFAPAAGCLSTPSDMCRFAAAHFLGNSVLIDDHFKREAHKSAQTITEGQNRGYEYGLGFEVMHLSGHRLVGHGGTVLGYRSTTFFDPSQKLAVSVAVNCKDALTLSITRGIFGVLYHYMQNARRPASKEIAKFAVRVQNPLANLQIVPTKNAIVALDPDDWEPFLWSEHLTRLDGETLQFADKSVHTQGEKIRYNFKNSQPLGTITSVGLSMYTEDQGANPILASNNQPYTVPLEDAELLFLDYLKRSDDDFFRFEVLPEYDMGEDEAYASRLAWLQGDKKQSRYLLEILKAKHIQKVAWVAVHPKPYQKTIRIRLVDEGFSEWMRWEQEYFARVNVPLLGERIYYVPRKSLGYISLPRGDVIICNNMSAIVNNYQGTKLVSRTFYPASNAEIGRFLSLKEELLSLAQKQRPFLLP